MRKSSLRSYPAAQSLQERQHDRARQKPMKRTTFKVKPRKEGPTSEKEPKPLARAERMGSYSGGTTGPAPKESVLESAAYENAVRDLGFCVRCGRTCRPQFCHTDMGKGVGIKTDVRKGWAGCGPWGPFDPGCHHIVGRELSREARRTEEAELARRTRAALRAAGTWPRSVPQWVET